MSLANRTIDLASKQVLVAADGTAAAPSITNDGDTNTGMFFPAADTIAFSEGGTEALRLTSTGAISVGSSGTNYGSSNQVLTSQGNTSPTWVNAYTGFKNRIINGAMVIDQRGNGASAALSGSAAYPVDRFVCYTSSGSGNTGIRSTTVPSGQGFVNSLLVTVGTGASPSASSYNQIGQMIEGFNVADLGYGGSGAKTTTLSFWVRASITGTYCVAFLNSFSAGTRRSYVAEYSISSANTWEYKTVTITGDITGTWSTDNTQGLQVYFDIGSGSNFQTTVNTWGNGAFWRTSNQTNLIATNGATFYITGVQLEAGSTATEFERRPYGTELALCQRYYHRISGANGSYASVGVGVCYSSSTCRIHAPLPVFMRVAPTVEISTGANYLNAFTTFGNSISSIVSAYGGGNNMMLDLNLTSNVTAGQAIVIYVATTNTNSWIQFNSEL